MAKKQNSEDPSSKCPEYLKALADPLRLQIVRALQNGPMSVSDLSLLLESDISTISHHLRVMYHADLVTTERDGKFIYYSLNADFIKKSRLPHSFDFGCCSFDLKS
ncbi:MAG: HTH-type transcriptional regulator NmtR [Planctomycetota bacterium]|jgi:DNA-binding transcriptional ArsR family regulator